MKGAAKNSAELRSSRTGPQKFRMHFKKVCLPPRAVSGFIKKFLGAAEICKNPPETANILSLRAAVRDWHSGKNIGMAYNLKKLHFEKKQPLSQKHIDCMERLAACNRIREYGNIMKSIPHARRRIRDSSVNPHQGGLTPEKRPCKSVAEHVKTAFATRQTICRMR